MMATPTDWETQIQDAAELEPAIKLALASACSDFPVLFEQLVASVREVNADNGEEMTFERLWGWLQGISWAILRLNVYIPDEEQQQDTLRLLAEVSSLAIELHRSKVEEENNAALFGALDFDIE